MTVTYTRDALDRIASKTERVGKEPAYTFSYAYDLAGQLIDVAKDGNPTAHYAYDANGNRIAGPGLTASPAYDAQDRLLSYGNCSYTYKADGSLQTKTCPDGTTTYDYDAFGNLRNAALPNGTHIEYVIDGQNRRAGKTVCATTINVPCPAGSVVEGFLYRNMLQPAAWLDANGAVKAIFIYGQAPNIPEYMVKGGINYRLVKDQVGSVRLVVDPSGNIAERIDYNEFGNVLSDSAPGFQPFGFGGGLRDLDTGLMRFGARDYDPLMGRWSSKDPIRLGGGSANPYAYVSGNPITLTDPLGLYSWNQFGYDTANAVVGFGDGVSTVLTLGLYSAADLRHDLGINGGVDTCSASYAGGRYFGYAWGVGTWWAVGLNGGSNSVFWAGRGAAAEAATMGTTIAQTPIGALLTGLGIENRAVWAAASATFAGNASGTATAVVRYVAPTSLWLLERAILSWRNVPLIYR